MLCSYLLPREPGLALIFGVQVQVPQLKEALRLHLRTLLSQNLLSHFRCLIFTCQPLRKAKYELFQSAWQSIGTQ